jgi:hypothetical protein
MVFRVLAVIILLFSVLYMPFWLSVVLALAGMIYFSYFAEATVLFLLSDVLYGVKEARFSDTVFVSFIVSAVCLVLLEMLKRKLKFYNK